MDRVDRMYEGWTARRPQVWALLGRQFGFVQPTSYVQPNLGFQSQFFPELLAD